MYNDLLSTGWKNLSQKLDLVLFVIAASDKLLFIHTIAYLKGVTGLSDGESNGFLGLFFDCPNVPFLGLAGLYIVIYLYYIEEVYS